MSNDLIEIDVSGLPAALVEEYLDANDEITSGVGMGMARLSIRGKVFRLRHKGGETALLNPDGSPQHYLDLVIVEANPNVSKTYFKKGYKEGEELQPDCMAIDGKVPDAGVPDRQNPDCKSCRWNVFGSKVTDDGRKTWACANSRRLAVVPLTDLECEEYGGPVLLRVPGGSLGNLEVYGKQLKNGRASPPMMVTRVSMDINAAAPVLEFRPIRVLKPDEFMVIDRHRKSGASHRIVTTAEEIEEAVPAAEAAPAPKPKAAPRPKPAPVQTQRQQEEEPTVERLVPRQPPKPRVVSSEGNGFAAGSEGPLGGGVGFGTPKPRVQPDRQEAPRLAAPAPSPIAAGPPQQERPGIDELIGSVLSDLDEDEGEE